MLSRLAELYKKVSWYRAARAGRVAVFSGDYPDYATLAAECDTYQSPVVIDTYRRQAQQIESNPLIDSRSQRLLAALALPLSRQSRLRVMDVGGGFGTDYSHLMHWFRPDVIERWAIVENPKVVSEFRDTLRPPLFIFNTPEEAGPADLTWMSGTLQYLPDPHNMLQRIVQMRPKFLCVSRTTMWSKPTRLMKQSSPRHTYGGLSMSYPCWILNREEIRAIPESSGYALIAEYEMPEDSPWVPGHGHLNYGGMWFSAQ